MPLGPEIKKIQLTEREVDFVFNFEQGVDKLIDNSFRIKPVADEIIERYQGRTVSPIIRQRITDDYLKAGWKVAEWTEIGFHLSRT